MKKTLIALVVATISSFSTMWAQTGTPTKIGYTDVDLIMSKMPETKKAQNEIEVTRTQLQKAIQEKTSSFQTKLEAYQKDANTMNEVIRADKEKELQSLEQSIQELQQSSQASMNKKMQDLLTPILDKINKAIQEVGKENNYLYVINSFPQGSQGTAVLLYVGSEEYNVTNLVLKKLGVDPNAPSTNLQGDSTLKAPASTGARPK